MKIDLTLLKRIHYSISIGSTGCPKEFSKKLDISLRSFHEYREYLVSELFAPIAYSRSRQSYYYVEEFELYIGDLSKIRAELITGMFTAINSVVKI